MENDSIKISNPSKLISLHYDPFSKNVPCWALLLLQEPQARKEGCLPSFPPGRKSENRKWSL